MSKKKIAIANTYLNRRLIGIRIITIITKRSVMKESTPQSCFLLLQQKIKKKKTIIIINK